MSPAACASCWDEFRSRYADRKRKRSMPPRLIVGDLDLPRDELKVSSRSRLKGESVQFGCQRLFLSSNLWPGQDFCNEFPPGRPQIYIRPVWRSEVDVELLLQLAALKLHVHVVEVDHSLTTLALSMHEGATLHVVPLGLALPSNPCPNILSSYK